jgi:predicted metal-dependent hydrolase
MVKIILISAVFLYVMSKFSTQIFRFALWLLGQQLEKEIKKEEAKVNGFKTKNYDDVTVYYKNGQTPQKKQNESGDYVDFEEVK